MELYKYPLDCMLINFKMLAKMEPFFERKLSLLPLYLKS